MRIVKASAGSGKTYLLANTYVDLLLDSKDQHPYRHILAVTFTNKATEGMKTRILKVLSERAATDPRARSILIEMLHDYSAFSVSTIDRFFQQTLKAFARELGQFSAYQIELDRDSLIGEAMDRILDSLSEDKKELIGWIRESLSEKIEAGDKFKIEDSLHETGKLLKNEEHRELCEKMGIDEKESLGKTGLSDLKRKCTTIIKDFEAKALEAGAVREKNGKIKVPGVKARAANPDLADLFDDHYPTYNTATRLHSLIFSLGLAGEFYREFDALLKEKNVMCLDESNTLLRKIIGGSSAPFVYEKTGVRYDHFLLDEFQDTSNIQWENFKPLLEESEGRGGNNLIVGDVKQSIYRWRNSDWKLLGERVEKEFPSAKVETKQENWRSCAAIVNFNNRFFEWVSKNVGVEKLYSDVAQKILTKDKAQSGEVKISFRDDIPEAVLESVNQAREQHASWSDIAVLVRGNAEGSSLAAFLIEKGIPVISDDSLKLKSSITVRRLVSLLSYIENPEDSVGSFLASTLGIEYPETFHSLVDLAEGLLRPLKEYSPEAFDGEVLFVQAFMDELQNWTETNGNNLRNFLRYWEEKAPSINCPEESDAIRIITIHKSKGLEFPYLIFPYAEKVEFYKHGVKWCGMDAKGTELEGSDGIYPVDLSEDSGSSLFSDAYEEERRLQLIDNINVFYVALTRAEKTLHVISSPTGKTLAAQLSKKGAEGVEFKRFSDMLYAFTGQNTEYREGSPYDFDLMPADSDEGTKVRTVPASYESIPIDGRLTPSSEADDFFSEDGAVTANASARLKGIVLHDILSEVTTALDLGAAVEGAVRGGLLSKEDGEEALGLLSERIATHPEWFSGAVEVQKEITIFGPDGLENRPDRVIINNGAVTVIDYKFGDPHPKYRDQVRRYVNLYHQLGYPEVEGYLWFVRTDEVIKIS